LLNQLLVLLPLVGTVQDIVRTSLKCALMEDNVHCAHEISRGGHVFTKLETPAIRIA
jgi:hypothetical protein